MYYANDGAEISAAQIKAAVDAGTARIIYSRKPDGGLYQSINLSWPDMDTRGQCARMSEEVWTARPSYAQART